MNSYSKILIIDDGEVERLFLSKLLAKYGYDSISLSSGAGIHEIINQEKPSLILLDMSMPDVSGREILQEIRLKYNSVQLPVIMISSTMATNEIVDMLKFGANDYITKPINTDITIARIGTHLKIARLSYENTRLREKEAIQSMTATLNHEINNPLAIALGNIEALKRADVEARRLQAIEQALFRVRDIVRKIENIRYQDEIFDKTYYSNDIKMMEL